MDAYQQQLAELQRRLGEKDELIVQLQREAQGAAHAVQQAQAEAATANQAVQQLEERIAFLEVNNANNGVQRNDFEAPTPEETVLKNLRTPQTIRDLPIFTGNPTKLNQFLKAVDHIMPTLEMARGSPCFNVWIQSIRSKITDEADTVLELYGTELSWREIKSNLIMHYHDKRDEVSLTRDMYMIKQEGSVESFYSSILNIISLLVNKLSITETNPHVKIAKNRFYQETGLKVFLAGLKDPLGPIIRAQAPESLKEALTLCHEESNYNYVRNPFRTGQIMPPTPPRLTPRPLPTPPISRYPFRPNLHTQPLSTNPFRQSYPTNQMRQPYPAFQTSFQKPFQTPFQTSFQKPFQTPFQTPFQNQSNSKPFGQPHSNPLPRPTPMEVDQSLRVNYMNRPRQQNPFLNYNLNELPPEEDFYLGYEQPYVEYNDIQNDYVTQEEANPTPETGTKDPATEPASEDDLNFQMVEGYRCVK